MTDPLALGASAASRLVVAGAALGVLWLAVWWAL
jgi:hypothetical protein